MYVTCQLDLQTYLLYFMFWCSLSKRQSRLLVSFLNQSLVSCSYGLLDNSAIHGQVSSTTIPYDYLVFAVGAETQTFGIPGVKEHACFMKELSDAERVCNHSIFSFVLTNTFFMYIVAGAVYGLSVPCLPSCFTSS
jgi:hypothetical protein